MKNFLLCFIIIFGLLFLAQSIHITHKENEQEIDTSYWYRLTTQWQGEGKSLEVKDDKYYKFLQLADTADKSGQLWRFSTPLPKISGQYSLTTKLNRGQKLAISEYGDIKGRPVMAAYPVNRSDVWKLTEDNGWYRITSKSQPGKSIDIINDGKENNLPQLADTGNWSGQLWKLTPVQKIKFDNIRGYIHA